MDTPLNPPTPPTPPQPVPPTPQTPPAFSLGTPAPATAPTPPVAPVLSTALPTVVKAGFFSGKIIAILAVAVIGGGGALGYFVFPEPFYNTVGKYIGLPAPTEIEATEEVGEAAEEPKDIFQSDLLEKLPGANANVLVSLRLSEKTQGLLKNILEPQDFDGLDWSSGAQHMAMAVKLDFPDTHFLSGSSKLKVPVAVALQMDPSQKDATLEELQKDFSPVTFVDVGENILIGENPDNKLEGKFSENPMYKTLQTDSDLAVAFDFQDFVKKNPPRESDLKDPKTAKELEFMKKVKSAGIFASLKEEDGKINVEASARMDMEDAEAAQEMLPYLDAQLAVAELLIPEDYRAFIDIKTATDANAAELKITIKDVDTLGAKIKETSKLRQENTAEQEEDLKKMFEEKENELDKEKTSESGEVIELTPSAEGPEAEEIQKAAPARPKIPRTPIK